MEQDKPVEMKVSSGANVAKLAASIQKTVLENPTKRIEIRAIGAGAVNQAIKGAAVARGHLASTSEFDLAVIPRFSDIEIDGEHRSAVALTVVNLAAKRG